MKQLNGVGETARIATSRGYLNKQNKPIRARALTNNCLNLGSYIGASRSNDGLHWLIDWPVFEKWLSNLSNGNQAAYEICKKIDNFDFYSDDILRSWVVEKWNSICSNDPDYVREVVKIVWDDPINDVWVNGTLKLPNGRNILMYKRMMLNSGVPWCHPYFPALGTIDE